MFRPTIGKFAGLSLIPIGMYAYQENQVNKIKKGRFYYDEYDLKKVIYLTEKAKVQFLISNDFYNNSNYYNYAPFIITPNIAYKVIKQDITKISFNEINKYITDEQLMKLIKEKIITVEQIKDRKLSDNIQLEILHNDIKDIKHILNPCIKIVNYVITNKPEYFELLNLDNLSDNELNKINVNNCDKKLIELILQKDNLSPKIQLQLIKNDIEYIKQIKNPSHDVIKYVINNKPEYIQYINNFDNYDFNNYNNNYNFQHNETELTQLFKINKSLVSKLPLANNINRYRYKEYSYQFQQFLIDLDLDNIKYIYKPVEKIQNEIANKKPENIKYINDVCKSAQLTIAESSITNLKYIKNLDDNIKLSVILRDPNNIKHIDNPTEDMQIIAVKHDKNNLLYIKNPCYNAKLIAYGHEDVILLNDKKSTSTSTITSSNNNNISYNHNRCGDYDDDDDDDRDYRSW